MSKQEGEVKAYMFARKRQAELETSQGYKCQPGKAPTSITHNNKSISSNYGNNKGTSSNHRMANKLRATAKPQQHGTRSSLEHRQAQKHLQQS